MCDKLGIAHYVFDHESRFRDSVIDDFADEYMAGRTPIPCVHCNGDLKFRTLLTRAQGLNADFVATGHYARVERAPRTGRYLLKRGVDPDKLSHIRAIGYHLNNAQADGERLRYLWLVATAGVQGTVSVANEVKERYRGQCDVRIQLVQGVQNSVFYL